VDELDIRLEKTEYLAGEEAKTQTKHHNFCRKRFRIQEL
jgi:hypothetical protein